jgi:hypothetical protein
MSTLPMPSKTKIALIRGAQMAAGAAISLVLGLWVGRTAKRSGLVFNDLTWSDAVSLVLAAMLLVLGLMVALASLNRQWAGRMLDPKSGRPATAAQATFYGLQGVVLLLAGLSFAAPVIAQLLFAPLNPGLAPALMMAIIALFLVQTVANLTIWRRADELHRQVMAESGAACFWLLQAALFLWACAEKLGLAPTLTSWDSITILMGVYLTMSAVISIRRGLG